MFRKPLSHSQVSNASPTALDPPSSNGVAEGLSQLHSPTGFSVMIFKMWLSALLLKRGHDLRHVL